MPRTLEIPTPSDPVGPVVPDAPTVPADPVPGPEAPDLPDGPGRARAERSAAARARTGPEVPSPDPGGPRRQLTAGRSRAGTGFDFADPFELGVLFVGLAVFAAVGALSHQHERAFSASLDLPRARRRRGGRHRRCSTSAGSTRSTTRTLIEHLAEAALVIALFSAGLKLDRPLTFARLGHGRAAAAARHAAHDRRRRAARRRAARALGGGRAAARRRARADRPGARRRHRRRPARRRGRARAELRADRRGRAQRRPRRAVRARRRVRRRARAAAAGRCEWLAADVVYAIAVRRARSAPPSGSLAAWSVKRLRSREHAGRRRSTASTRSPPRSSSTALAELAGRLRLPRRLRGRRSRSAATSATTRSNATRARGRRADGEAARARGDPAARLDADHRGPQAPGLGGLAARRAAARRRAPARVPDRARRLPHGPPGARRRSSPGSASAASARSTTWR